MVTFLYFAVPTMFNSEGDPVDRLTPALAVSLQIPRFRILLMRVVHLSPSLAAAPFGRQKHGSLDEILQFSDIARPVVFENGCHHIVRDMVDWFVLAAGKCPENVD